jgi:benzoyl-CoA reductase/2-hydroxyglutaryl-CoA dehydratase subunit BcrC/BadD/HgdB
MFPAPHVITPESIKQSKREIIRLKSALEKHFGVEITQDKIKEAIATCNETRKLLSSLYELRKKDSPPIKGSEVLSVVLACTALPKNVVNESLKMLLTELTGRKVVPEGTPRLMIAAGLLEEVDYMELLEKDAIIVADSLCFGSRYWRNLVDEDGDSIEALAYRYGSIACPRMVESYDKRIELLNDDIREYRTDGLIVENLKFCLHWQLFRFMIENEVESGVRLSCPLLVFERELHTSATGQVKTRVQAFLELLRERKPSNTSVKN